jgi:hypothetical protein
MCGVFSAIQNGFIRSHIFEMPILGYAGYLSFGLECGVIADLCTLQTDHM